jgi:hypothetical protein
LNHGSSGLKKTKTPLSIR